jgi:hypothetical protein
MSNLYRSATILTCLSSTSIDVQKSEEEATSSVVASGEDGDDRERRSAELKHTVPLVRLHLFQRFRGSAGTLPVAPTVSGTGARLWSCNISRHCGMEKFDKNRRTCSSPGRPEREGQAHLATTLKNHHVGTSKAVEAEQLILLAALTMVARYSLARPSSS